MGAVCAACERPLATGEPFVLAGSEVFHARCARGIGRSRVTRLEAEIARLHAELVRERGDGARARIELQRIGSVTKQEIEDIEAEARKEIHSERVRADHQQMLAAAYRQQRDRSDTELSEARARVTALEAQLAARNVMPITPPTQPASPEQPKNETVDDAAIRFSLLDLDPL